MNILACTTPTMLNNSMPPAAGGQGFLSRMILVYGTRKYKQVARPMHRQLELVNRVKDRLNDAYHRLSGPFDETQMEEVISESLYQYGVEIVIVDLAIMGSVATLTLSNSRCASLPLEVIDSLPSPTTRSLIEFLGRLNGVCQTRLVSLDSIP
jgi:hypothetical protein